MASRRVDKENVPDLQTERAVQGKIAAGTAKRSALSTVNLPSGKRVYLDQNENQTIKRRVVTYAADIPQRSAEKSSSIVHPRVKALQDKDPYVTPDEEQQKSPPITNIKVKHALIREYNISQAEVNYNLDYIHEYFNYLMYKDVKYRLMFGGGLPCINSDHWTVVLKYLLNIHVYNEYPTMIFYQTLKMLYTFLQHVKVPLDELQSVSLACMWIVLKKDGSSPYIPTASDVVKYIEGPAEENMRNLVRDERRVLAALKFGINFIDIASVISYCLFCRRYSKTKEIYYTACYMIELAMFDMRSCTTSTINLAIAAVTIATVFLEDEMGFAEEKSLIFSRCSIKLESDRKQIHDWQWTMVQMAQESLKPNSKYAAVYKRFSVPRYREVSEIVKQRATAVWKELWEEFC